LWIECYIRLFIIIRFKKIKLKKRIDIENLHGMSATLFVALNEKEERTYENTESILPYKNKHGDIDHFALLPSGDYIRVIERPDYKEPQEYAEAVNGQPDHTGLFVHGSAGWIGRLWYSQPVKRAVEVMVGEPSRQGVMVCPEGMPMARGAPWAYCSRPST